MRHRLSLKERTNKAGARLIGHSLKYKKRDFKKTSPFLINRKSYVDSFWAFSFVYAWTSSFFFFFYHKAFRHSLAIDILVHNSINTELLSSIRKIENRLETKKRTKYDPMRSLSYSGFEPETHALKGRCSTYWANSPHSGKHLLKQDSHLIGGSLDKDEG